MKVLLGISLCCLLAHNTVAQRGGGFRGGFGGLRGGAGSLTGKTGLRFPSNRSFQGDGLPNYDAEYLAYYDGDYGVAAGSGPSAPSTIIALPLLPPAPAPAPQPARPVIHEYHWPNADPANSPPEFSIVAKNNEVHRATLLWIDGNTLHFSNSNGGGQLSRASISRGLTYQANPGKNLKAWLS